MAYRPWVLFSIFLFFLSSCATTAEKKPENAELHMHMGISYLQTNNLPLALKELLIAEELNPKSAIIQNNLGLVYFLRQKYDLSIKHFSRAYDLDKTFTEAKNNLARVYIEVKQYKQAEKLLHEVLEDLTYVNVMGAHMNFGMLYFNQKRYQEAKVSFRKVLEFNRQDCFAHVFLGRSYLELKENRIAADQLDRAVSFCTPSGVDDAYYYAAIAYYRLGIRDKSLVRFEELIKLFPNGKNRDNAKEMIQLIRKGQL